MRTEVLRQTSLEARLNGVFLKGEVIKPGQWYATTFQCKTHGGRIDSVLAHIPPNLTTKTGVIDLIDKQTTQLGCDSNCNKILISVEHIEPQADNMKVVRYKRTRTSSG